MECAPQVLAWIENGTPLIFQEAPRLGQGRPNYVPQAALAFANEEVTRLLLINAIEEDDGVEDGYTFPLGAVPKDTNKWRLICDLTDGGRGPNASMPARPFKMEHVEDLLTQIGKDWWGLTFDLRAGFHHLEVQPKFRRFLRFRWAGKLYHFNVMPFGPRHSPLFFNKVVKEFIKILRRGCAEIGCTHEACRFRVAPQGIVIVPFVDDFCASARTKELLLRIRDEIIVPLMKDMGWIRALGKGSWEPLQIFDFLGLTVDTVQGLVLIPEKKLKAYSTHLDRI